jgi:hypothetical protein
LPFEAGISDLRQECSFLTYLLAKSGHPILS